MGGKARLTGEINDMPASIPGAECYFRRSLHVKNRDHLYFRQDLRKGGGGPLIIAYSVIRSGTVYPYTEQTAVWYNMKARVVFVSC